MQRSGFVLGLVLLARPLAAQSYDVSWYTIDGGGATSSAGAFVVSGTIAQPDAGGPFAGSPYVLHSGFWSLIAGGTQAALADLSVTKTDGQTTAVPGQAVTYTIVASNAGPTAVTNATVTDTPPATLTGVAWTCTASAGSSCPASGSGGINHPVSLVVGGVATFSLTGAVAPGATGTLANTASIAPPAGVTDASAANNSATDTDTLTPRADLSLAISDSPDPVTQGGLLTYTFQVANLGPSTSPGMTLTDTLSIQVSFVSSTPGSPTCTHSRGTLTCSLGSLAPSATATVTLQVAVSTSATGSIANTGTVGGAVSDPVLGNNSDTETTQVVVAAESELSHGTRLRADLAGLGGAVDVDLYRIRQEPRASYEVVLDETSGDVGLGSGPALERVGANGATVLQAAQPVGAGPSRSLRFANTTSTAVSDQLVRVRSTSCGSDCGTDDVYRLRSWETTASIPRFNNSTSQITVVILQNRGSEPISGQVVFWNAAGALVHQQALSLGAKASLSLNTAAIPALQGQSGSVTVVHDGSYGTVAGKAVALEPLTGLSFDSVLESRPR